MGNKGKPLRGWRLCLLVAILVVDLAGPRQSPRAQNSAPTAARFAYVTNQGGETVTVVDLDTLKSTAEIKVPGKPAGIATSKVSPLVFVTAPDAHDVVVIDTQSNAVVRRIAVGGGPVGIAVHPITDLLFVADWYSNRLSVVNPVTGSIVRQIEVGQSPSGVAITADGTVVVTADRDSNAVSVIDSGAQTRVATIAVGARPFGITVSPNGERAYTANVGSDTVSVIDLKTRSVIATVPVGHRPYAVALSPTHGFVTDQYGGTVSVFNLETNISEQAVDACDHPEGIAYDASRDAVFVACWFDNTIIRINPNTRKLTSTVTVGDGPRAFGDFLR